MIDIVPPVMNAALLIYRATRPIICMLASIHRTVNKIDLHNVINHVALMKETLLLGDLSDRDY